MATTVNSLSDWTTVMPLLLEQGIVGKDVVFGVLVGPSSHSPVPKEILAKVIKVISEKVIKTNGITCLWNGGDPCFRESRRGGNIADVIKGLVTARVVQAGAIQKSQWMPKAPTFNTTRIAYGPNLAKLNGRSVFGGYEVGAKPEGWSTFISKVEEVLFSFLSSLSFIYLFFFLHPCSFYQLLILACCHSLFAPNRKFLSCRSQFGLSVSLAGSMFKIRDGGDTTSRIY
eukprot:TRINITY_DN1267_c0_g1_i2.p1 TRINITY_DN1267_c0_g1~~TRINITY_DN1267_c0_g1_i2.p1  ORF type:complete len:240 (-),score=36.52 TRINITY_DN1267_c0_g1_i2:294-980(-)